MEELKKEKIWVLFRKKPNGKGGFSKVPCAVSGGVTSASEIHKDTWVTYDEAIAASKKIDCDGVGFVIPDGYFLLDMDKYDPNSSTVKKMLKLFGNTYAELSVSENGIHIYGKCRIEQLPTNYDEKSNSYKLSHDYLFKNEMDRIELYIGGLTSRYSVYTGNEIQSLPIGDCTEQVNSIFNNLMNKEKLRKRKEKAEDQKEIKQETDKKEMISVEDTDEYDEEAEAIILALAGQLNGQKFRKLFYEGNTEDYETPSNADQALCAIISYRTDDEDLIERIIRKSKLYRAKWDREDYAKNTIRKGIEIRKKDQKKPKRPDYIVLDKNQKENLSVTRLAKYIRKNIDYILVKNDAFQGTRVYVYEGGFYKPYDDEMLQGLVREEIEKYNDKFARMSAIREVVQNIKSVVSCAKITDLDANESIINFENGILRVSDTEIILERHTPDIYSTVQIPCRWHGCASPTPIFDKYMETLTNGDKEIEQLLLQFMGVCISNVKGWRLKKSLFMVGEGNSGKSQLKSLVEKIIGQRNFMGIELKEIEARFGTGAIYGKRLVGSSDMSFLSIDELKTFKKMTGGDSIFGEQKHQQGFQYTFNGLLWFAMNRLPRFSGDNGQWVYDRIMVVKCDNTIPLEKQDKQLLDKMYAERDGIIYKMVKALQQVIANGYKFDEPDSVKIARNDYQKKNSTVISFWEECMCDQGQNDSTDKKWTTGKIYDVYTRWCKQNNNGYQKTAYEFREEISKYLGKPYSEITRRVHGQTYYKGFYLTLEAKVQYGNNAFR